MGLTIHYTLTVKRGTSVRWFKNLLHRTWRLALKSGCPLASKVLHSTESDPDVPEWFQVAPGNRSRLGGGPGTHGWLLEIWPGESCETALFGTLQHRRPLPRRRGQPGWRTRYSKCSDWKLQAFCKTCYAARHGTSHFIECHLRVIRLLDFLREAGLKVEVHDETGYWKTRRIEPLLSEGNSYCAWLNTQGKVG